jgi:hypothetical protein
MPFGTGGGKTLAAIDAQASAAVRGITGDSAVSWFPMPARTYCGTGAASASETMVASSGARMNPAVLVAPAEALTLST